MNFLEMDQEVKSSFCSFWVDDVAVRIVEAASMTMPPSMNPKSGGMPDASQMKMWRVTYQVPTQQFVTNLTAQSVEEAKRMVWEHLKDKMTNRGKTPLSTVLRDAILQAAKSAQVEEDPRSRSMSRGWA